MAMNDDEDSGSSFNPFAALASAGSNESKSASYMGVASTHTLLNSYQSPDYSWDDRIANVGKFAVSAMFSGVDSLANTAISGYNFFGSAINGSDFQKSDTIDTAQQLSDIDSDLGAYYTQNKQAVDVAGFLVTSLIPGFAGIKALNVGQKFLTAAKETGLVGGTLARFTGLLTPSADAYIGSAATEIAQSQAAFAGMNVNLLKGIGAGFGQATLESAAFEVAVTATMNQSPVLEGQDIGDLVQNVLIGGALGGAIGGIVTTAKTFSKVKSFVKGADLAEKPFTSITELPTGVSPMERVIQRFSDRENIPAIEQGTDYTTKHTRLAGDKTNKLMNLARQDVRGISSDDTIGNMVMDNSLKMNTNEATASYFGVQDFTRVGPTDWCGESNTEGK